MRLKDKSKMKFRNKHKITTFENLLENSTKYLKLLQNILKNGFIKTL